MGLRYDWPVGCCPRRTALEPQWIQGRRKGETSHIRGRSGRTCERAGTPVQDRAESGRRGQVVLRPALRVDQKSCRARCTHDRSMGGNHCRGDSRRVDAGGRAGVSGFRAGRQQVKDQAQVEHEQWLRGQRQEAYADFLAAWDAAYAALKQEVTRTAEHWETMATHDLDVDFDEDDLEHAHAVAVVAMRPMRRPRNACCCSDPNAWTVPWKVWGAHCTCFRTHSLTTWRPLLYRALQSGGQKRWTPWKRRGQGCWP
ncbi:hypothetical protein SBADM41S_11256 [Streptomyces badius]